MTCCFDEYVNYDTEALQTNNPHRIIHDGRWIEVVWLQLHSFSAILWWWLKKQQQISQNEYQVKNRCCRRATRWDKWLMIIQLIRHYPHLGRFFVWSHLIGFGFLLLCVHTQGGWIFVALCSGYGWVIVLIKDRFGQVYFHLSQSLIRTCHRCIDTF